MKKDIFISHASEDKHTIIEPLVQILEQNGISYWYDNEDIGWGDNIVEKINNGLAKSSYFLVVLSDIFLSKNWAKTELNTLMNIEISTGETRVLPLIIGNANKIHNQFKIEYPLLHPKLYLEWNNNPENVAKELKKVLKKPIENELSTKIIINQEKQPPKQKAKTLTQLITLFNPQQHLDETQHHFFVNIFGKELDRFVTEIVHAPDNQTFFITGQSGNGKTSMLRNLQTEYPEELKLFHFFYLEGRDLLNLEHLKIEDVMYKIATKLMPLETITENLTIDTLNGIIKRYEDEVLEGKKRLVLVIDDFEKLVIADLNKTDDVYYKFLFEGIPSLKYLNCIKLVTFPFHFKNRAIIEDAIFKDFIIHLDATGSIDVQSIQEVILKRLDNTTLISELALLISSSGANMRQLIQMVHDSGIISSTSKGTKINRDDIKKVVAKLSKDFANLVESNMEFYRYIKKHHTIDFENSKHQKLLNLALRSRTVFAYLYEERYYYAVNPVVLGILEGRGKPNFVDTNR